MSTYKELEKKDDKALAEFVNEKREAIRNFRFSNTGSATRNVKAARADKKEVARALTLLNARKRNASNKSE